MASCLSSCADWCWACLCCGRRPGHGSFRYASGEDEMLNSAGWQRMSVSMLAAPSFTQVEPRAVPSKDVLGKLRSVLNARDLAEACRNIAPGRILRSACPTGADEHDTRVLRRDMGVAQLVDLRSDYERKHDRRAPLMENVDVVKSIRRGGIAMPSLDVYKHRLSVGGPEVDVLKVHHISLLEKDRYYRSMVRRLPLATTAALAFWSLANYQRAVSLAIGEINREGLPGLYETILESAKPEIRLVLQVLTEAAETGEPILLFCKVGKDRTGLMSALVLACCGASEDEIVSDYVRSDKVGAVALGGLEHDKALSQLDTKTFERAPAAAMAHTLHMLWERYGGMLGYLDSIGFDGAAQRRLARALADAPALPRRSTASSL